MIKRNQVASFYFDFGIMGYQDVLIIYDWIDGEEAKGFDQFDLPIIKNVVLCNEKEEICELTKIVSDKFKAAIRAVIRDKSH